jgi:hypothetical protein
MLLNRCCRGTRSFLPGPLARRNAGGKMGKKKTQRIDLMAVEGGAFHD